MSERVVWANGFQVAEDVFWNKKQRTGALNADDCPTGAGNRCRCEPCAICGYHKHMSVHLGYWYPPRYDKLSKRPYGHRFVGR